MVILINVKIKNKWKEVSAVIMRTIIKTVICVLSLVIMSSCTYKSDDDIAEEKFLLLINLIFENNKTEITNLFSENISDRIDNFDNQVLELIDFVEGTYLSSKYTGTGAEYTIDGFEQVRFLPISACELYTTDSKYYFSILYCSVDDFDGQNVGIWNLLVQKCSDKDDAFMPYSSYEEWMNSDKYRGITLI